jgi:3-oxoadipate enol-lactonase
MTVALHHEVMGPPAPAGARAVLLGGSLGSTLEMWDPQVPALAERLRVVRFDVRGHGRSPVPAGPYELADLGRDVLALMDALAIDRAAYAGLSIGGMVGMWLAAHAPERIDRLALLCTSAHLPPASMWAERAATVRAAGSTGAIADAVVARWLTEPFARAHPELLAELRAMLAAQPPDGYAACCGAIERMDLRPDLGAIRAPVLVVAGADDRATPPEHARVIAGAIPGARLEVLAPAAHLANVEQPEAVTRLLLDHLDLQEAT